MSEPAHEPEVPVELRPVGSTVAGDGPGDDSELFDVAAQPRLRAYLRQLWAYREFAITIPLGQLRARSQHTSLGRAWYLLNPLLLIAIYYAIFEVVLGIESRRGVPDYLPFLTVGVIVYSYTRSTVQSGATSLTASQRLVRSLRFPRTILPFGVMVAQTSTHLYAIAVLLVALIPMGQFPSWRWLLLPVALLLQGTINLGLTMYAARLTFTFPDLTNLLPFMLRLGLYVSGVLIPINAELITNDLVRTILQLNPIYNVLEIHRQLLLGYPHDAWPWIASVSWAVLLLVTSSIYFRAAEDRYASG